MTTTRILSIAFLVTSIALSAAAQDRPAAPAPAPMASASMPQDCAKTMARHDHGAERNAPRAKSAAGPCAPGAAASAPKAKLRHDHAKFHKNQ